MLRAARDTAENRKEKDAGDLAHGSLSGLPLIVWEES